MRKSITPLFCFTDLSDRNVPNELKAPAGTHP